MGRHAVRQRTGRAVRPLAVAVAVGVVTVGTGTLVLLQPPRTTAPATVPDPSGVPARAVTLAVGGAVSFGGRTLPLLEDPAGPFAGAADVLGAADVTLVDLVAPADGAAPPAAGLVALTDAGVDGIGRLDPRWTGTSATDTSTALAATGLGHGPQWQARTGPVPVAVFSTAAGAVPAPALLVDVSTADRAGDVVVVRLVTPPGDGCPAGTTPDPTAALVAAGADVVVGGASAGQPGSWADADRRTWVLPVPGPLLEADDDGPVSSELVVLRVSADGVQDVETVPLRIDAFGRAQPATGTATATPVRADPCTPPTNR